MRDKPSQSAEYKEVLEALRDELDGEALLYRTDVSELVDTAYDCWSAGIFKSVFARLQLILEEHKTNARRQPDAFAPHGPEALLKQGDMHLLDQVDGVPFMIDHNMLLTGVLIIVPQGSGKSRFIRHLIEEFQRISP